MTMHHIVYDGWTPSIIEDELAALYDGRSLEALPLQYPDFAAWQRAWIDSDEMRAQLEWWREQLAGAAPVALPSDRPRPAMQTFHGEKNSKQPAEESK